MFGVRFKKVSPKWLLQDFEEFYVGDDNKVYRTSTNREVKMVMKKYTRGFYLNRKFFSVTFLRKRLIRIAEKK